MQCSRVFEWNKLACERENVALHIGSREEAIACHGSLLAKPLALGEVEICRAPAASVYKSHSHLS